MSTRCLPGRLAPAKINLALHVVGRRADGYHQLETLVVFASHGDRLEVEPASQDAFELAGPFAAAIPTGLDNLVLRARDRLRAALGAAPPVRILLRKHLPPASGIGGGSSDAAAVLLSLRALWAPDLPLDSLASLALPLGADVPMCLFARPLLARGVGEALTSLPAFPDLPAVLVNPGAAVSTPTVFSRLAAAENPPLPALPNFIDQMALLAWLSQTRNDLEAPARALAPRIGDCLSGLERSGARFVRMSGSGATCFGLFPSMDDAGAAAAELAAHHPGWYVQPTLLTGAKA